MGSRGVAAASAIGTLILAALAIISPATAIVAKTPGVSWLETVGKPSLKNAEAAKRESTDQAIAKAPVETPAKADAGTVKASSSQIALSPKPESVKPKAAEPKKEAAKASSSATVGVSGSKTDTKPITPDSPQSQAAMAQAAGPAKGGDKVGSLVITSTTPGASVFLDGNNVGATPIEVDVSTGGHQLRVVHPTNGTEKLENVILESGRTTHVKVEF